MDRALSATSPLEHPSISSPGCRTTIQSIQAGEKPLGKCCCSSFPGVQEAAGSSHPLPVFGAPTQQSHTPGSPLPQPTPGTKPLMDSAGQEGKKYLQFQALEHLVRAWCFLSPQTPSQGGGGHGWLVGLSPSFPTIPVLCPAPRGARGKGAVGQVEPSLLHKAHQPAALGCNYYFLKDKSGSYRQKKKVPSCGSWNLVS